MWVKLTELIISHNKIKAVFSEPEVPISVTPDCHYNSAVVLLLNGKVVGIFVGKEDVKATAYHCILFPFTLLLDHPFSTGSPIWGYFCKCT